MELEVQKSKLNRLYKLYEPYEYHGWVVTDPWIHNKYCKNYVTNDGYEISYVTREKNNPLPFHTDINYVGIVHMEPLFR